jgi:hypothetical protein
MNNEFKKLFDEDEIELQLFIPYSECEKEDDYRICIYSNPQFEGFFVSLDAEPPNDEEKGIYYAEERLLEKAEDITSYREVFEELNRSLDELGLEGYKTDPEELFQLLKDSIIENWGIKQLRYLHEEFHEKFPETYPIIIDPDRSYEEHLELVKQSALPQWAGTYTEDEYNNIVTRMLQVTHLAAILSGKKDLLQY